VLDGSAWVSTQKLAREALHVLSHLAIPRAHVFGLSLGGMTATWLAIFAQAQVAKLCIASAPARGLSLSRAGLQRELALAACFAHADDEVEQALVKRILSRGFCESRPDEVRRIADAVRAVPSSRASLLKHALAGVLHDARGELHRIEGSTLVLAGQNDTLLGTEPARALAAALPQATFEIIAASGHDLTLEQPLSTATRILQFLLPYRGTHSR
jgi:pimeloyl-ACP methyl ester carboxylesterase